MEVGNIYRWLLSSCSFIFLKHSRTVPRKKKKKSKNTRKLFSLNKSVTLAKQFEDRELVHEEVEFFGTRQQHDTRVSSHSPNSTRQTAWEWWDTCWRAGPVPPRFVGVQVQTYYRAISGLQAEYVQESIAIATRNVIVIELPWIYFEYTHGHDGEK